MAKFYSRLVKKEEARSLRRTVIFGGLSVLFILGLVFFGIPSIVRMAGIFADLKSSNLAVERSDVIPPSPPKINSLPEATGTNPISVTGFAEQGSTVEIFLNGSSFKNVVVSQDGTFLADNLNLEEGQNEIYAITQDAGGNKSQPGTKINILFDKTPPPLEINQPQNGANFIGEKQKKIQISGKTEPGTTFAINRHFEILDKDGNFTYTATLSEGENLFKFEAQDLAGNIIEKEIKVSFTP